MMVVREEHGFLDTIIYGRREYVVTFFLLCYLILKLNLTPSILVLEDV
jgi:hypothetical protein